MRSSAVRIERNEETRSPVNDADLESFARELSDLCRKHGIGITGTPTLFMMEPIDYQLNYQVDDHSNLSLR